MYTSTQDFTLACASPSTGATVVRSATATSIISQRDAYLKAYGLARARAVEWLQCSLESPATPTIYYNVSKTGSVSNDPGYEADTFQFTVIAGAVYSLVSQAEADDAAQVQADYQAELKKNREQVQGYYSAPQTITGSCGPGYVAGSVTVTRAASAVFSVDGQVVADSTALSQATSELASTLASSCVGVFFSDPVSHTAECSGGLVGNPVTVSYPAGQVADITSQSTVNSQALSTAVSAATGLLDCVSGYWNAAQSSAAPDCGVVYGSGWVGGGPTGTVSASMFFDLGSLSAANSKALSSAGSKAFSSLTCEYIG